jgi:hypothetical protein
MALLSWLLWVAMAGLLARRLGGRPAPWMASAGWLGLPFYNRWVLAGCPGDCAIRVDLLIVLPVLAALSLWALVQWLRAFWKRRRP